MELQVQARQFRLSRQLREHVERRINFALGHFDRRVWRVAVSLSDANGPKGGVDKQCQILIHLRRGNPVKVKDVDVDFRTVVDRAADRAGRAVARRLQRRRERKGSADRSWRPGARG
jgi:ribosomal subunit interface protein